MNIYPPCFRPVVGGLTLFFRNPSEEKWNVIHNVARLCSLCVIRSPRVSYKETFGAFLGEENALDEVFRPYRHPPGRKEGPSDARCLT